MTTAQAPGDEVAFDVGSGDALQTLYSDHAAMVFGYLVRRTGSRDAAEDLTSEVFLRAILAFRRFEWRGVPMERWLIRIADHAATDWYRRGARRPMISLDTPGLTLGDEGVEDQWERETVADQLYAALNDLSPARRQVVILRLGESLPFAAVARRLGRHEGATRMLYQRALHDLRERLTP